MTIKRKERIVRLREIHDIAFLCAKITTPPWGYCAKALTAQKNTDSKKRKMASPKQREEKLVHQIMLQYSEDLVRILKEQDTTELCTKFLRYGVISVDFVEKFDSLDDSEDHLSKETRVRYLLQQVCEGIREDSQVYEGFIRALAECGSSGRNVCEEMNTHLKEDAASVQSNGYSLHEKDIPMLLASITEHYKWEEIGIALGLPKRVIEECRKGSSDVLKLNNVLLAWINSDIADEVKPATMESLRVALAGNIVGLNRIAQKIEKPVTSAPAEKKTCGECESRILNRFANSIVTEGKSTLLEVRVDGRREKSYQWSKNGQPLLEGIYFSGVSSNMLYINRASQHMEGRYSCSISNCQDTVCSGEIDVKVVYPPEREHLLQYYHGMRNIRKTNFVNLVLIKQKARSRCDYTIRGDVDDILENKEVAQYEEIFSKYKEGEVVLIEGRPGSGKTTLVHKITQDWAQGKPILQGAKYVFLVTLREINYSKKDESLLDIIDIFYDSESIKKKAENEIKENRGKGVCFIIDGLDEYQNKNKESEIYKLMNKKVFPSSMVIVASRPAATHSLRDKCARRVEVVGFTKDQINKYVETYFSDCSVMTTKMKKFLDKHPKAHHMCYLPVQAEIICFLFHNKGGNIPHTETRIYEEFTVSTINRHKQRYDVESQIQSLEELQGEDKPQFSSICKLAFEMTINSQQVVSKREAQKYLHNTECFFGLLTQESKSERLYVVEEIYTFHHLTFQEYLAAHHIASLTVEEQVQIIYKYGWSYVDDDDVLRNVRKFYCGLVAKLKKMKVFMKNEWFLFDLTGGSSNVLYCIQCAFESQQIDFCNFAMRSSEVDLFGCTTTPLDFAALGYVISTTSTVVSKLRWNTDTSEDELFAFFSSITQCALRNIKVLKLYCISQRKHDFCKAINYLPKLSSLEKLQLDHFVLNKSFVMTLTRNIQIPSLRYLSINFSDLSCSNPEKIFELLKLGSCNTIKVYYSCRDKDDYGTSRKLLNYVFDSSAHQASDISWLYLYHSNEISSIPPERFSHCTNIVLVNCGIDDIRAEILAGNIQASVVEKLVLDFNRISDSGAKALAEHLAGSCALQVFSLQCNCIRDSGAAALASSIAGMRNLRRLDLQGNDIGDEGVVAIAKATQETSGLELYLYNVEVTQQGISRVLEHRATTHIKTIVFGSSWDSICDEGIEALRSVLKWGGLQVLRISGTEINSLAINMDNIRTVLAEEAVGKIIRLLELGVVDEETVPALCGILERARNLKHLRIYCDDFKDCVRLKELFDTMECLVSISICGLLLPYFTNSKSLVHLRTLIIIGKLSVHILCEVLLQLKSLSCLKFLNSEIDDTGAIALAEALKDHTSLTEVDLSHYGTTLSLSVSGITAVGMSAFAPVVRANNIQHLNISGNKIDFSCDDLLLAIADSGDSLQSLCIGSAPCNLGPYDDEAIYFEGTDWNAEIIIDGLCKMKLLVELGISNCDTSQVELLAKGLECCSQLVKLGMCYSATDSQSIVCLSESIACCNQLEELNLFHDAIDSQGMISLAVKLTHHEKLQKFNLASNKITSDGVPAIVLVLENCRYLRELDLRINDIGIDGAALLVEGWKHKTVLMLKLSNCLESSCALSLLEGEEHCPGCGHLLQLCQFNDNIAIELNYSQYIPKLESSVYCFERNLPPVSC